MANLTRASKELFRRTPDEFFPSLDALWQHCNDEKERSADRWQSPQAIKPTIVEGSLGLTLGDDGACVLNDWSFGQLCRMAGIGKETVNRLTADTARRVFDDTLPAGNKPIQVLTSSKQGKTTRKETPRYIEVESFPAIRSIHGHVYTRLWNADLVAMLRETATGFQPPPRSSINGATGLYCGEQDMFCFLIDPTGWAEIDGQPFAPGFFVFNSEVGSRAVGIESFWFQAVCMNHIVWDATEVASLTRKHTSKVTEAIDDIRRHIETLVNRRDERRDGFVRTIKAAMEAKAGDDTEEVLAFLTKRGMSQRLAARAVQEVEQSGSRFTIFAVVDALTRLAREERNANDRTDLDKQASRLLAIAA